MTADAELTQLVREWLRDGTTELPDRVLHAVVTELPATPQRPRRRRPGWPAMLTRTPIRAGLAAAILVLGTIGVIGIAPHLGSADRSIVAASPSPRPAPDPAPRAESPAPGPTEPAQPVLATSPVPGARLGELTLVPHAGSPTDPIFVAGAPIDGHLRTDDALSTPGVPIRLVLFRRDPADGLVAGWSEAYRVTADQTDLDVLIDGQEPGSYRLVAYHAMTEPLAVVDLTVVPVSDVMPTPPALPEGWQRATSGDGTVSIGLPGDFGVIVDGGSLTANPPPGDDPAWITVLVEVHGQGEELPPPGPTLAAWLNTLWFENGSTGWSPPVSTWVQLPAGEAIRLTRTNTFAGTPWTSTVYGMRIDQGIGVLVIEGPTDQMDSRADDLALIPQLLSYP